MTNEAKRNEDTVEPLVGFSVPTRLIEVFDDFVVMGVSALSGASERSEWTQDERDIVEWLESRKYKANK